MKKVFLILTLSFQFIFAQQFTINNLVGFFCYPDIQTQQFSFTFKREGKSIGCYYIDTKLNKTYKAVPVTSKNSLKLSFKDSPLKMDISPILDTKMGTLKLKCVYFKPDNTVEKTWEFVTNSALLDEIFTHQYNSKTSKIHRLTEYKFNPKNNQEYYYSYHSFETSNIADSTFNDFWLGFQINYQNLDFNFMTYDAIPSVNKKITTDSISILKNNVLTLIRTEKTYIGKKFEFYTEGKTFNLENGLFLHLKEVFLPTKSYIEFINNRIKDDLKEDTECIELNDHKSDNCYMLQESESNFYFDKSGMYIQDNCMLSEEYDNCHQVYFMTYGELKYILNPQGALAPFLKK